ILMILIFIITNKNYSIKQKTGISFFIICTIGSLLIITNIVKIEMRISSPTFLIIFASLIFLIRQINFSYATPFWEKSIYIFISVFFGINTFNKLYSISENQS